MKGHSRVKVVPLNAENLTKDVINRINAAGYYAFRVNTTGIWDQQKKTFRRTGGEVGTPDILACISSKFIGIEVKIGNDKQSLAQKRFQKFVETAGGIYMVVKTQNDFLTWFSSL